MKHLLISGLLVLGASSSLSFGGEPDNEGVYRINDRGSRKLYAIDFTSVYNMDAAKGDKSLKLGSNPKDLKAYRKAFQTNSKNNPRSQGIVFYPVGYEHQASLRRVLYDRLVMTVKNAEAVAGISQRLGAKSFKTVKGADGTVFAVLTFKDALEVLDKIEQCKSEDLVLSVKPLLSKNIKKMTITPTDPLFTYSPANLGYQWHLWNTGEFTGTAGVDVNIRNVWDSYTGKGVTIGIADDGLEIKHPDLEANTDGMVHHNWAYNSDDPTPAPGQTDSHGTSVGGVSAAAWFNGVGGCGSAPEANLVGLRWLVNDVPGYLITPEVIGQVLGWGQSFGVEDLGATNIDVHNNSWGPGHPTFLAPMDPLEIAAIESGIQNGRGGLGTIYMFASGNDRHNDGNANYGGYVASRYTIGVGAINDQGTNSAYSNPGCALIVSAPSSDEEFISGVPHQGITTTELQSLGNGYTDGFGGTSSATPLTTGIVALMLEANPKLGWRDVQEILIASARKIDEGDEDWQDNAGGYHFNHRYGAGMVDAEAAVNLAKNWVNLAPETSVSIAKSDLREDIPDEGDTEIEFNFWEEENKRVENVLVNLKITHPRRQDLECVLISPTGVESRMTESFEGGFEDGIDYTFLSTFCWGEDSMGIWKVRFYDRVAGVTGMVENVKITIFGVDRVPEFPPVVLGSSRVGFVVNSDVDYPLNIRFADTAVLSRGVLPPGLVFDPVDIKITGTPTEIGSWLVEFLFTNQFGSTKYSLWIYVGEPPSDNLAGAIEQDGENVNASGLYGDFNLEYKDTSDGSDAVVSFIEIPLGNTGLPVSTYGESHISLPASGGSIVMFNWKVESREAVDRLWFSPSGGASGMTGWHGFLSGKRDWGAFASPLPKGSTVLTWSYMENRDPEAKNGGGHGYLDQVKVFSNEEYSNLLTEHSGSTLKFEIEDRALWTPTKAWLPVAMEPDLANVLQASAIGNAQHSDLKSTIVGPGKVSFRWRVSSDQKDKLQWIVAGTLRSEISGDVDWVEESMVIPAGAYDIVWRYTKNSRDSSRLDTGFVSGISYIPYRTYEMWSDEQFTDAQMGDPLISGPDADPNGNGINNLLEYAFGGNPLVIDGSLVLPGMVMDADGYGFTFRKNTGYTDIEYVMESSNNLTDWSTVTGTLVETNGAFETYRYDLTPSAGDPKRFLRVRVVK